MQLTVSTRIEKRKKHEEKSLLWHNVRASKVVDNVRDDSKNIKVFGFENGNIGAIELNTNNKKQNIRVLEKLQDKLDSLDNMIEEDYKQNKGKKLPKNAIKFIRGVITFGTDRVVEETETKSLNDEEVAAINQKNENDMDIAALNYMKRLEKVYGIKIAYITRHDDEKTRHYHFTATQYNFKEHKMLTSGFKKRDMQNLGETLQDMVAGSFDSLAFKRGKKGSKSKHLTVKAMHSNEIDSLKIESMKLSQEISKKNQLKIKSEINYNNFVSAQEIYEHKKNPDKYVLRVDKDKELGELKKDILAAQFEYSSNIQAKDGEIRILKKKVKGLESENKTIKVNANELIDEVEEAEEYIDNKGLTAGYIEFKQSTVKTAELFNLDKEESTGHNFKR